MKRRLVLPLIGAAGLGLMGQSPSSLSQVLTRKPARIGFLHPGSAETLGKRLDGFRQGLRDYGYVEGQNIEIEFRWAGGASSRLPELAADLVRLKVDVIMTAGTPATMAAKGATTMIPIVMTLVGDAIASGVIDSLAQPGGNVTGGTFFLPQICVKRLELLKEALPKISQVAVLVNADNLSGFAPVLGAMGTASQALGVRLHRVDVRTVSDLDAAFVSMAERRIDALVVVDDTFMVANAKAIGANTASRRIPAIGFTEVARAGGLLAYGVNGYESWRRAAYFVDKILKGTAPSAIPVEQPVRFELVINLKAAGTIGATIPRSVLLRADEVIE